MSKPFVLCIDDEDTVLESLKIELRKSIGQECIIETAQGGEEALEILEELLEDNFELAVAISDYIMPGRKGDEVLKEIHEKSPQTITVMLTAQESTLQPIVGYLGDHRTLLVIDDHRENRAVFQSLLAQLDFKIVEATNGEDGLRQLQACQPDAVILDLDRPVMDGFEFLQHLRNDPTWKAYRSTPVIVSSASVGQSDQQMALDKGGDAFLAKPVDAQALFQVLAEQMKLDWVFEDQLGESAELVPIAGEVVLPSRQILKTLLTFAQLDNINDLREHLDRLIEKDDRYFTFADPILQLAKQYRTEEIETLLQEYLALEQTNGE